MAAVSKSSMPGLPPSNARPAPLRRDVPLENNAFAGEIAAAGEEYFRNGQ